MFLYPKNAPNEQTQKLLAFIKVFNYKRRLCPTYHVVFIGSNFPAVFEEVNPWLGISLGLAHHNHLLSCPPLQDAFRMDEDFGGIFSSPSSCKKC